MLDEVIERSSGPCYGNFLKTIILDSLGMTQTSLSPAEDQEEIAEPYAVLDDYSHHRLPFP